MLKDLFKPIITNNQIYHFKIGYQDLIVLKINEFKESIIVDKIVSMIIKNLHNYFQFYIFNSFDEMEYHLGPFIDYSNDNFFVIIN